jgi:hypothetical protein
LEEKRVSRKCIIGVVAALLFGLPAIRAGAQTLFTTEDFRKDHDRWTDPAYYLNNTARELSDMQVEDRFGQKGSGEDLYNIKSPYPYKSSWEHYQAWLAAANGGIKHKLETLPNWDGVWGGGLSWLASQHIQASTVAAALTPQYREYYVQQVKAEAEGRHWWAAAFCLPDGFIRGINRAQQFVVRPNQVLILSDMLISTQVRWIHTDGGHAPEAQQFARWMGESVGFWDGNALVVHTNQIRQWNTTHAMFEWSDQMTAVERYERRGNTLEGEITLYDPVAFLYPLHAKFTYNLNKDPQSRMLYSTCTDTNGPSSNIYVNAEGRVDERVVGDPGYWDSTNPRPWAAHYAVGEKQPR